jgi:hypothetical protein
METKFVLIGRNFLSLIIQTVQNVILRDLITQRILSLKLWNQRICFQCWFENLNVENVTNFISL